MAWNLTALKNRFNGLRRNAKRKTIRRPSARYRPMVEGLEERVVPSTMIAYSAGHTLSGANLSAENLSVVPSLSGFSATDSGFSSTLASGGFEALVIGEGVGSGSGLSSSTRSAIAGYAGGGGHVVVLGSHGAESTFLNSVFGFSTTTGQYQYSSETITRIAGDGPASLAALNATWYVNNAPGVVTYRSNTGAVAAFTTVYGSGEVSFLSWDFCCDGTAAQVSAWYQLLEKTVANNDPTAEVNGPYTVAEGGSVALSSVGSNDPDGSITTYEWDFDYDGITFDVDATGPSPIFSAAGLDGPDTRILALRVTDNNGATAIDTATVNITNVAPTLTNVRLVDADGNPVSSVNEGQAVFLEGDIADPGTHDSFTLTVDWGEGDPEVIELEAGTTSFSVEHVYDDDNPPGTPADDYEIQIASLIDDDGESVTLVTSFQFFSASSDFTVPNGVTSIKVLAIGGGGGGANGHQGGGGAGFVEIAVVAVMPGATHAVIVGAGGTGAQSDVGGNAIIGLEPGTASSFGAMVTAAGGGVVSGINLGGQDGSSGGGGACNSGSIGGSGGTGGTSGQPCQSGFSMPLGLGEGDYTASLALFTLNTITAGSGGTGGTGTHAGAGGGGGILVNGAGPSAGDGLATFSAHGGEGYGAGGGAGGLDFFVNATRYGGGDGADGLVYIEYVGMISVGLVVHNVAPNATFNAPDFSIIEGDTFEISLTEAADISMGDTDAGFEYAFDCGDGVFGDFSTVSTATCTAFDGDDTLTVRGQIRDDDGGVTEITAMVTVLNVAPQIDLGQAATPTAVDEVEPNNALASPQLLGDGTDYDVTGSIATLDDVDFYSFNAEMGTVLHFNVRATNPLDPIAQQLDPLIGLYDPSGVLVDTDDDQGEGSFWAAGFSFTITETGTWTVAVSDYDDFDFDGVGGDEDGYGTDIGDYILSISSGQTADREVNEGDAYTLNLGDVTDPGDDIVTAYEIFWGDGSSNYFEGQPTGQSHNHIYDDGPNNYTITVDLTDEDDTHVNAGSLEVTVNNVAPEATFGAPDSVTEGDPFVISLIDPTDPSSADAADGFEYSFDCGDGNGFSEFGDSNSASCTIFDEDEVTVLGQILDKDGDITEYDALVTINKEYDLVVTKEQVSGTGVISGTSPSQIVYVVTLTNNGVSDATGVKLFDDLDLPTGVSIVSIVASGDTTFTPEDGVANNDSDLFDGTWTIDHLADGDSVTLTVTVQVGLSTAHGAVIENSATLTAHGAGETETDDSDNADSVSTTIVVTNRYVRYVTALHHDVLGRAPTEANMVHFVGMLDAGTTRFMVAKEIWSSAEHRGLQVDQYFRTYFGPTAVPTDPQRATYISLFTNGKSEADVIRAVLGSAEYRTLHADNANFVDTVYAQILGRGPTRAEKNAALGRLNNARTNAVRRDELVKNLLSSKEKRQKVVDCFFADFVDNQANPALRKQYVNELGRSGVTFGSVAQRILANDDYFQLAQERIPALTESQCV